MVAATPICIERRSLLLLAVFVFNLPIALSPDVWFMITDQTLASSVYIATTI